MENRKIVRSGQGNMDQLPRACDEVTYCALDNGISGSIGIVRQGYAQMLLMPTRNELDYTKAVRHVTRVDWRMLRDLLNTNLPLGKSPVDGSSSVVKVFLERPFVNPKMFRATLSAIRAMEATLIVLEAYKLPLQYIDSREWQKIMLPSGLKGSTELKQASQDVGCRLWPNLSGTINRRGDADSLLMAEWARRERL